MHYSHGDSGEGGDGAIAAEKQKKGQILTLQVSPAAHQQVGAHGQVGISGRQTNELDVVREDGRCLQLHEGDVVCQGVVVAVKVRCPSLRLDNLRSESTLLKVYAQCVIGRIEVFQN